MGCKYFGILCYFCEDFFFVFYFLVYVFILGLDSIGYFIMSLFGCMCSVVFVDIIFYGGIVWIYNLFFDLVVDKLKDMIGGGNGIVSCLFLILIKS